jgi:TatD DNase family protein
VTALFDTHCHLTDRAFAVDLPSVLVRARESGVEGIVSIASTVQDSEDALARVADGRFVWTTVGTHPHEAEHAAPVDLARMRELTQDPRVVALGECGLDYHYDLSPRDVQRRVFDAHVALAAESGLPLVVHSRSADADMAAVMRSLPGGVKGVLHCFGGTQELLDLAIPLGWNISVTGLVTFKKFDGEGWLRSIPEDRLMIETDAPYMAPMPYRGKRNEPGYVCHVADAVARHRGESPEHVRAYTDANARRFYALAS